MEKIDARKLSTDVQQELRYQVIRLRNVTADLIPIQFHRL